MHSLNWIDPNEYDFNCMLLMEGFQIDLILSIEDEGFRAALADALRARPAVSWYFAHRLPQKAALVEELVRAGRDAADIRAAELTVLDGVQDFVIYTTPEQVQSKCDWVYGWNEQRLYELADFAGRIVLDVGSGTGRLAFAAAKRAKFVCSCEPVESLRRFQHQTILQKGIANMRVGDGLCTQLPFPDNSFDIAMSGHVLGDDLDKEIGELSRVVKHGGWLLDCPGDQKRRTAQRDELKDRGWEELAYMGSFGQMVYRYRRQVFKD